MRIPSTDIYPFDPFDDFYEDFCNRIQDGENPEKLLNNLNNTVFIFCIGKAKDIYWRKTDRLEIKKIIRFWKWQIKKWLDRINNDSCTNPYKEIFEKGFQYFSNHINEECEYCMNEDVKEKTQEREKSFFLLNKEESKKEELKKEELKNLNTLYNLYKELLNAKFIGDINYDCFKSHFVNQNNTLPLIEWLKPLNQLHYFVDKLQTEKMIRRKKKWEFTVKIFQHNGKTIEEAQLRHTKLKDDISKGTIDDIVEKSFRID